jgi:hypothetical protein
VTAQAWLSFLRLHSYAESRNDDCDDRHAHDALPPRLYAVIAVVVRRASLRTKKAHGLIPLPSSGSTPELPHAAKATIEFIR